MLLGATARPLWIEGHALGALFLAVGASTGAAAIALILMLVGRRADAGMGGGCAPCRARPGRAAALGRSRSSSPCRCPARWPLRARWRTLTSGQFKLTFWLGAILVGCVLPLLIGVAARRSVGLTALASLLVLVGGFLVKFVIMAAGQV